MARTTYSPQHKAKLVLEVLSGEKEQGAIAHENGINPNMLRVWKREFLKKESDQMLKTIGQLTLERDFLQGCFRQCELLGITRSTVYYEAKQPDEEAVRLKEEIMGWELSDTLETTPVLEAVRAAVERFGTPAILNSDQGSQFSSDDYKALLKSLDIRQSMDGKSHWADNIMIERWFRNLKTELIYVNEFRSPKELRQAIRQYVNDYNTLRPHEALDYETPEGAYLACFAPLSAGLEERRWPVEPMPARMRRSQNKVEGTPSRPAL